MSMLLILIVISKDNSNCLIFEMAPRCREAEDFKEGKQEHSAQKSEAYLAL